MPLIPTSTHRSTSSSNLVNLHPRPQPFDAPSPASSASYRISSRPPLARRRSATRLTSLEPMRSPSIESRPPLPPPPPVSTASRPYLPRRRTAGDLPVTSPSLSPGRSRSSHPAEGSVSRDPSRRRRPPSTRSVAAAGVALDVRAGHFRFRTDGALGKGASGTVFAGIDERTGRAVAVKVEPVTVDPSRSQLANEVSVVHKLAGGVGMPRFRGWSLVHLPLYPPLSSASAPTSPSTSRASSPLYPRATPQAQWSDCALLITDRLGPSVAAAVRARGRRPELETLLRVGAQLVERLEFVHKRGFIHRDVKPDNILLGLGERSVGTLHLVDFGLAQPYRPATLGGGPYLDPAHSGRVVGTHLFMSRNASCGLESTPRDDLESVGYILLWLLGPLPWTGLTQQLDLATSALAHADAFHAGVERPLSAEALDLVRHVERAKERVVRRLVESSTAMRARHVSDPGRPGEAAIADYFRRLAGLKAHDVPDYRALRDIFVRYALASGFARSGPAVF